MAAERMGASLVHSGQEAHWAAAARWMASSERKAMSGWQASRIAFARSSKVCVTLTSASRRSVQQRGQLGLRRAHACVHAPSVVGDHGGKNGPRKGIVWR